MDQLGNDVYISLDQSTTACGYAVWENSCLIGHGVYKPSALDSADKRIEEIRKCAGQQFDPTIASVFIESVKEKMN